jgi:hypothetical protein
MGLASAAGTNEDVGRIHAEPRAASTNIDIDDRKKNEDDNHKRQKQHSSLLPQFAGSTIT